MMVVGLLFLIGGVGVLLTMNRLLWPLGESAPAGGPGEQPGRTPVAGGRPGPARHPRDRTWTAPAANGDNNAPPPARQVPPPARRRARAAEPVGGRGRGAESAGGRARAAEPAGRRARATEAEQARQQRGAQSQQASSGPAQGTSRAWVKVVTVPDRTPARRAAGGQVYGGARRA
ncbi:hypothetical protein AB0J82_26485 [Asanoa sp. NPDC049518]|uniref:hypothetical protein n=1 Tax=unclassified Asanoa TaxID=2685164 RepID=UPI003416D5F5